MTIISQYLLRTLLPALGLCSLFLQTEAWSAELPAEIKESLEQNATSLNPIQAKWHSKFKVIKKGKDLTQYGLNLEEIILPGQVDYCWQDKRLYVLVNYVKWDSSISTFTHFNVSEISFDGTDFYSGSGKQAHLQDDEDPIPVLEISPLKKDLAEKANYIVFQPDYLAAAGYLLPSRYGELLSNAKSTLLESIRSGSKVVAVENDSIEDVAATKVILTDSDGSTERFWLATERHFVLLKYEKADPENRLLKRISNSDWRRLPERITELPSMCEIEYFAWGDQPEQVSDTPVFVNQIILEELNSQELDDQKFRLDYDEGGSVISDARPPEAAKLPKRKIVYSVPARKEDLEKAINAAKQGKKFNEFSSRKKSSLQWLIGLNVFVLIVIIAWFLIRKSPR